MILFEKFGQPLPLNCRPNPMAAYAGIFQADAFGGYNRLYETDRKPGLIAGAACWAHVRRPFF